MFIFTDYVPEPEHRFQAGYILETIVGICLTVNLIYLHMPLIHAFNLKNKRFYRKFCRKVVKTKLKPADEKKDSVNKQAEVPNQDANSTRHVGDKAPSQSPPKLAPIAE